MPIAYLASRYPAVSHTFIRREVEALRAMGLDIHTFSLRRTSDDQVLTGVDAEERRSTWSILPARPAGVLRAHASALWQRPRQYLDTLRIASRHRTPGTRAALWALFHFGEAILLAEELERRGISHLHSHFSNAGGDVGLLSAHFLGIPWSVTLHGSADFDSPTRSLLREKIAASTFVSCVSQYGRALAMRLARSEDWPKMMVVRCGVDIDRVRSKERARPKDGTLRLLSVGRLAPEKGFLGLIDAFAKVHHAAPDVELRIIGEGPERMTLETRIRDLGLQDAVTLPGHASEEEVWQEMANADVFAMSSFMEGLPVVLMESMALGVPVVAPRIAGIPELVEHRSTGLLYAPACFSELAALLQELLTSPELRERLGAEGRRRVESEFAIAKAVLPLHERFAQARG